MDSPRGNPTEADGSGPASDQFDNCLNREPNNKLPVLVGSHTLPLNRTYLTTIPHIHVSNTEASVVIDGGDTKQLEQTADRESSVTQPVDPPQDVLVAHIGDRFSDEELSSLDHEESSPLEQEEPSSPDHEEPSTLQHHEPLTLEDKIRVAMHDSAWSGQDERFLPINELDRIINKQTVKKELTSLNLGPDHNLDDITKKIWGTVTFSLPHTKRVSRTTRRKLFTILLLLNKVRTILDLIDEDILDNNLPFLLDSERRQLQRKVDENGTYKTIKSFEPWRQNERDLFGKYQWEMLAPFWDLNREPPDHYLLEERIILPFIPFSRSKSEEAVVEHEGGFSEVRKVKIHSAHHNYPKSQRSREDSQFFAVKVLQSGSTTKFDREVKNLKRFVSKNHPHLIRLLVTFKQGRRYHLVFPWADENLLNFWGKAYPNVKDRPCNADMAPWMSKQFMGLADGIQLIHKCSNDHGNQKSLSPDDEKIYGRHGDLKPENILWFKDNGMLQITDFGLADFHRLSSVQVRASQAGGSRTYRAPEFDAAAVSLPTSDMWSFGCILLEFVAWYLLGWKEVDEFSTRRMEDPGVGKLVEDRFFMKPGPEAQTSGGVSEATVKDSVTQEIQKLREMEQCSDFLCDVLDLIQTGLLQVKPKERTSCVVISAKFQEIYQKCQGSPEYCVFKTRQQAESEPEENKATPALVNQITDSTMITARDTPVTTQDIEHTSSSSVEPSSIDVGISSPHHEPDEPEHEQMEINTSAQKGAPREGEETTTAKRDEPLKVFTLGYFVSWFLDLLAPCLCGLVSTSGNRS
ncbi:hypothetical protein QQZ08_002146 [Neonectria magnoliae]|uniref:Protein kinase domain-containing protein n=1 Tax=Neonectria magnoliae TaxID=2732573 RepID=A0ABR1IE83_9HYPO